MFDYKTWARFWGTLVSETRYRHYSNFLGEWTDYNKYLLILFLKTKWSGWTVDWGRDGFTITPLPPSPCIWNQLQNGRQWRWELSISTEKEGTVNSLTEQGTVCMGMDKMWHNQFLMASFKYRVSSPNGHSRSGQLYLRPPLQNPVLLNSHTNSVFSHSRKRPAPVTNTFFGTRGCPFTRAFTAKLCLKECSIRNDWDY